tara:strand:- start:82 stop:276 length:195 start_codon:yes stop_codon:yes gene_type:complete
MNDNMQLTQKQKVKLAIDATKDMNLNLASDSARDFLADLVCESLENDGYCGGDTSSLTADDFHV